MCNAVYSDRVSALGITTNYELDVSGIESGWGKFCVPVLTKPASPTMGTGSFSGEKLPGAWCWPPTPFYWRGCEWVGTLQPPPPFACTGTSFHVLYILHITRTYFIFLWHCGLTCATISTFTRFLDHIQRRPKVGRTPPNEWSACRRDLYPTTHKTQQETDIHAFGGIRTHNFSRRAAADMRPRPRNHWDRLTMVYSYQIFV